MCVCHGPGQFRTPLSFFRNQSGRGNWFLSLIGDSLIGSESPTSANKTPFDSTKSIKSACCGTWAKWAGRFGQLPMSESHTQRTVICFSTGQRPRDPVCHAEIRLQHWTAPPGPCLPPGMQLQHRTATWSSRCSPVSEFFNLLWLVSHSRISTCSHGETHSTPAIRGG